MIRVQKSKLIKIVRDDDDDDDDHHHHDTLAFQYSRLWVNKREKKTLLLQAFVVLGLVLVHQTFF